MTWGRLSLGVELAHFILCWSSGAIIFGTEKGPHPILVSVFFFGWFLGFVGAVSPIVGLFRDASKWASLLGLVLFPISVIVTV